MPAAPSKLWACQPLVPLALAALLAPTGCGPSYPTHNGYRLNDRKPWTHAKKLEWSEDNEIDVDDRVSYPKRRRARWFLLTIPELGEIKVELTATQLRQPSDDFDLAFEILDDGGRVLIRADKDEDDAGEETKKRELAEMRPGKYLVHVYAEGRKDEAEFNLNIKYKRTPDTGDSSFPQKVAYVGPLATVPVVDDAPPPPPPRHRCRGRHCHKKPPPKDPEKPQAKSFRAIISLIRSSGGRTTIRIAAGANRGVEKGWRGRVITRSGSAIPDGGFRITRVTATESYASVKASTDAVNSAKFVRLMPN